MRVHDRSQKNPIRYLVRQSQHTIYCAMVPKSFSAVMVRKTTAQNEKHTKSVDLFFFNVIVFALSYVD